MKMKTNYSVLAVFFIASLCTLPGSAAGGADADVLFARTPADTEVMIHINSLEKFYDHLKITGDSIMGKPIGKIDGISKSLGFNPFSIAELKSAGINPGGVAGFFINDIRFSENKEEPRFNVTLFLPVIDGPKLINTLTASIKKDPAITLTETGKKTTFVLKDGKSTGYMLQKGNYILFNLNPAGERQGVSSFDQFQVQSPDSVKKVLASSKYYLGVKEKLGVGKSLFAYVNLKKIMDNNYETLKAMYQKVQKNQSIYIENQMEYLKDCEAAGMSIDFEDRDLVINSIVNIRPGSESLNAFKNQRFDKQAVLGINDPPVLLLSFAVNLPYYYRMMTSGMNEEVRKEYGQKLDQVKTQYGVDLEKDIIDNLVGNLNIGMYDGLTINMGNLNSLITLNVQHAGRMKDVIEKFLAKLPPEKQNTVSKVQIAGTEAYMATVGGMMQLFAGFKGDNLIISFGKPMFEKAFNTGNSAGFTAALADKTLASRLSGNRNVFYLNVDEIYKIFKNFPAMIPALNEPQMRDKIAKAAGQFEYLLFDGELKGNAFYTNMILKTRFAGSFFSGIADTVKLFDAPPEPSNPSEKSENLKY